MTWVAAEPAGPDTPIAAAVRPPTINADTRRKRQTSVPFIDTPSFASKLTPFRRGVGAILDAGTRPGQYRGRTHRPVHGARTPTKGAAAPPSLFISWDSSWDSAEGLAAPVRGAHGCSGRPGLGYRDRCPDRELSPVQPRSHSRLPDRPAGWSIPHRPEAKITRRAAQQAASAPLRVGRSSPRERRNGPSKTAEAQGRHVSFAPRGRGRGSSGARQYRPGSLVARGRQALDETRGSRWASKRATRSRKQAPPVPFGGSRSG